MTISPEMVYAGRTRPAFEDGSITVSLADGTLKLPLVDCPARLSAWIDEGRSDMYRRLRSGDGLPASFGPHLPVMVSRSRDSRFPFNCGNKGVGYLPKPAHLDRWTALYRETLDGLQGMEWGRSLPARLDAASQFNFSSESIDRRCFATIEIFEGSTFRNIAACPLASLLFTGGPPSYLSFQVNCVVEIIGHDDPRFTFITLSRALFEHDAFHIAQPGFRYGYVFWISEVLEKTPHRVAHRDGGHGPGPSPARGNPSP